MNISIKVGFITVILSCVLSAGCDQGPAEKAGRKVDNANEKISDNNLQDKGPVQIAGELLEDLSGC